MNQGDIYWINLEPVLHTEIGKVRPGMIISINAMNYNSPRVIIAPITTKIKKIYPFEVFIPCGIGGMEKDSKIMLDQLRSLDKKRLIKKIGELPEELVAKACNIAQRLILYSGCKSGCD